MFLFKMHSQLLVGSWAYFIFKQTILRSFLVVIIQGLTEWCCTENHSETFEEEKTVKYSDNWTGRLISEKCPWYQKVCVYIKVLKLWDKNKTTLCISTLEKFWNIGCNINDCLLDFLWFEVSAEEKSGQAFE